MTRPGRRLASVDIGSNTVHALVGEVAHSRVDDVAHFLEMCELGLQVDRTGRIGPASVAVTAALAEVVGRAADLGYERLLAGATAAVRRAADRDDFLSRASAAIGTPVRLLDERREAELSFAGAASRHARHGPWLLADVGGGSTELVAADGHAMGHWVSLRLGSGSLAARYLSDPPRPGERAALRAAAETELARALHFQAQRLVVTGGTSSHLPRLLSSDGEDPVLTGADLRTATGRLDEAPAAMVGDRSGLSEARIRAMRGGVELLRLLLERCGAERLHVSHAGLRQGMMLAYVERGEDWWR